MFDTQQLQLVIDMIMKLSDTGMFMFIWWLMASKVFPVVVGLLVVVLVYRLISQRITVTGVHRRSYQTLIGIRDILGITSDHSDVSSLTNGEIKEILAKIRLLLANNHQQEKSDG